MFRADGCGQRAADNVVDELTSDPLARRFNIESSVEHQPRRSSNYRVQHTEPHAEPAATGALSTPEPGADLSGARV